MNREFAEVVSNVEGMLADIEVDYAKMIETRDNILGGKATKEQMFVAVNAGATNTIILRGMCEKYLNVIAFMSGSEAKKDERRNHSGKIRNLHLVK